MLHWETARWSDIKNKKQEGNERNTADVFGVTAKLWINSRKCRKIHQSQITSQESLFLNVSITKVWGLALISSRPPLSHVTALSPPPPIFFCLNLFSVHLSHITLTLLIICSLASLIFAQTEWAAEMKFRLSDPHHLYPPSGCLNSDGPDWNSAPRLATCQVSPRTLFRAECRWRHKERR